MNDRLAELYRGVAVHATADLEHRAALELLALVMMADTQVETAEVDTIRGISEDWRDDEFSFEHYLERAQATAQAAIDAGDVIDLIADIDSRISSRVLRRALFSAAREVADADDFTNEAEGDILAEIAVRFG